MISWARMLSSKSKRESRPGRLSYVADNASYVLIHTYMGMERSRSRFIRRPPGKIGVSDCMRETSSVLPARAGVDVIPELLALSGEPDRLENVDGIVGDDPAERILAVLSADDVLINVNRVEEEAHAAGRKPRIEKSNGINDVFAELIGQIV